MRLQLMRPIVFFDVETTGTDIVSDRIVQIAMLKIHPDMSEEARTFLINPEVAIPSAATEIHHIADEHIANQPGFREVALSLAGIFSGCDIAGFNSNRFDLPLLVEEFARCGIEFPEPDSKLIDVQTIFHKKEERTLSAAYRFYCNRMAESAHDAAADVRVTFEVFMSQLERYNDIGSTVEDIHRFCNPNSIVDFARYLSKNESGEIIYNFGKHKGKPVSQELDYARWMLAGEFPEATKLIIRRVAGESDSL